MRFVNCAQSEDQQNLVSFQQGGEIYYRTCKAVDSGSELLVWFDDFLYTKNSSTQAFHSSSSEGERLIVITFALKSLSRKEVKTLIW